MFSLKLRRISAVSFAFLLAACGGGGEGSSQTTNTATSGTDTKLLPGPSWTTGHLRSAPADGATLSGIVRIEVDGWNIQNTRLLPAQATTPVYGKFNIVPNYYFDGSSGLLDLDTTRLPNGPLQVKIVAIDREDNKEVVLMAPRTWNISNSGAPAALSAKLSAAPENGATISGTRRLEVRGTGLANVELLPPTGYSPKHGIFNVSADRTYAWLDLDTRSLPDGAHNVRISAFNVTAGQSGAKEIVVMPSRRWNVRNGTDPNFTTQLLMAPLHGEMISGKVRLDISGSGLQNVELLPANGYSPKFATLPVSSPEDRAYIEFDPTSLPPGVHEFRISAFNRPAGASDAQEIVIMPARQWNIQY